jgi:hypothetical protein
MIVPKRARQIDERRGGDISDLTQVRSSTRVLNQMGVSGGGHLGWQGSHTPDVEVYRLGNGQVDRSESAGALRQQDRECEGANEHQTKMRDPNGDFLDGHSKSRRNRRVNMLWHSW